MTLPVKTAAAVAAHDPLVKATDLHPAGTTDHDPALEIWPWTMV